MDIEFDPDKNAKNIAKHGLPLAFAAVVLANVVGEYEDTRINYGEQRFVAFGHAGSRLMCCVYTRRGNVARVISLRKASTKEQALWRT